MILRSIFSYSVQRNRQFCSRKYPWQEPNGFDTRIKIYNCITKSTVPLILRNKNVATWYTCGPTVYDATHIGHASCYMKLDIIQRILRDYFHINLVTAMNITDIDDKIIKKSESIGKHWQEVSLFYEKEFWNDLKRLKIKEPNIKIRVTDNISEIIEFIDKLLKEELAYIAKDKSVYFKVDQLKNYGKLQHLNLENKEHDFKISNADFALWKAQKNDGEPSWPAYWGDSGRPGWHIECSALATKIFGNKLDFHAGGLDLRFPHHENEEAQSCAYHRTNQWVNYWLHTGHLNLKGQDEKMSKSLKNTISVNELLEKYSADEFRMACAMSNYRNSVEFSDEMMETAKGTLNRFSSFHSDCQAYLDGKKTGCNESLDSNEILQKLNEIDNLVEIALKDDFDVAKTIGHLIELSARVSNVINSKGDFYSASSVDEIVAAENFINKIMNIFGFNQDAAVSIYNEHLNVDGIIEEILDIRHLLRKQAVKDKSLFKICDQIRDMLQNSNIEIKDHSNGSTYRITKKS